MSPKTGLVSFAVGLLLASAVGASALAQGNSEGRGANGRPDATSTPGPSPTPGPTATPGPSATPGASADIGAIPDLHGRALNGDILAINGHFWNIERVGPGGVFRVDVSDADVHWPDDSDATISSFHVGDRVNVRLVREPGERGPRAGIPADDLTNVLKARAVEFVPSDDADAPDQDADTQDNANQDNANRGRGDRGQSRNETRLEAAVELSGAVQAAMPMSVYV